MSSNKIPKPVFELPKGFRGATSPSLPLPTPAHKPAPEVSYPPFDEHYSREQLLAILPSYVAEVAECERTNSPKLAERKYIMNRIKYWSERV